MANEEHLAILNQGADAWNIWRYHHPDIQPNLGGADLLRANLSGANLGEADLSGTYLHEAFLSGAYLHGANLREADLSEADLSGAYLKEALLIEAYLKGANLSGAVLRGADLSGANLERAVLVSTDLAGATLTDCRIYGISVWDLNLDGSIQKNLIIAPYTQPIISLDNLEVAQFIYLLLNNERIRDVINTITTKVVLILGRFTPERKAILDAIRDTLRKDGRYIPVLFDFDKPATRDTHETITTLARLARFVIADITEPKSIPQELVSIVEQMPSLPVQPLLQAGHEPWAMYDHIKRYPWVLELCHYEDLETLLAALRPNIIEPAEAEAQKRAGR